MTQLGNLNGLKGLFILKGLANDCVKVKERAKISTRYFEQLKSVNTSGVVVLKVTQVTDIEEKTLAAL